MTAFSGNGLICDFGKISLSIGKLQLPDRMKISPVGENEWLIEWQNDSSYPGTAQGRSVTGSSDEARRCLHD